MRTERKGRVYLDVFWKEFGVAAEVEGAHHTQGLNAVDDAVRQNEVSIVGDVVIRIPVLGLRLDPETFMAQLARALQAAAWRRGRVRWPLGLRRVWLRPVWPDPGDLVLLKGRHR